jgi:hypothetical protein
MVEFDRELQHPQLDQLKQESNWELPVRELMLRSFICRSTMELGQKHINFGNLDKSDRRTKRVVIRNKSEVPLLYSVKKSGSIASGDLIFTNDRVGVIRGYGRREVEFVFDPSLPGLFQEKLTIQNVQNPENDQTVVVKSNIKQPANFHIQSQLLSFGPCLIDQVSPVVQMITISNTSLRSSRMIEVRVDPTELRFEQCGCEIWFSLDSYEEGTDGAAKLLLSKETEEKIEQLEQKLKIAIRKGREDKAQKIMDQLQLLRSGGKMNDYEKDEASSPQNETRSPTNPNSKVSSTKDLFEKVSRVKATESSIIIPIQPRGIKVVKVHLKPLRLPRIEKVGTDVDVDVSNKSQVATSDSDFESTLSSSNLLFEKAPTELLSEICTARIYVHEQKNTDIVKRVLVKATVCYDQATYTKCLEEERLNPGQEEKLAEPSEAVFDMSARSDSVSKSTDTEAKLTNGIALELPVIDIGKIDLGDSKECYFTLMNLVDYEVPYYINVPTEFAAFVSDLRRLGSLQPKEVCKIELSIKPKKVGFGVVKIHVKSSKIVEGYLTVTFVYFTVLPSYLQFSLPPGTDSGLVLSDPKQGAYDLDFGYCFVDSAKKFAKVIPLRVHNKVSSTIYVSAQSNLALQCFLYTDENLEVSWSSSFLQFAPLERRTVYIALQPGLVSNVNRKEKNSGTSISNTASSDCRSLIGGIRVSVYVKDTEPGISKLSTKAPVLNDGLVHAYTHTLKFNATIGTSILMLSTKLYDFGTLWPVGSHHQGFISISNVSQKMPLDFVVESSSSDLVVDKSRYHFDPIAEGAGISELVTEKIAFSLHCRGYGYFNHKLKFRNLNNSGQSPEIVVQAFVDPKVLDIGIMSGKTAVAQNLELKWDNIYITPVQVDSVTSYVVQQKHGSDSLPLYEQSFEVFNQSDELLHLVPTCDLGVTLRWHVSTGSGFSVDSQSVGFDSAYQKCGSMLLLHPKERAVGSVTVPEASKLVNVRDELNLGKKVSLSGTLLLQNPSTHIAYKAMKLISSYCLSLGSVEPNNFDFGRVGYVSKWQDVLFEFVVQSTSEIPLRYDLEHPDCCSIESISESQSGQNVIKRCIEPGSNHKIKMMFKPRKLVDCNEGVQQFTVQFINLYNPQNIGLITCRYYLTQFELKFDRLNAGELVLPALVHPTNSTALPCDNWFVITNTSNRDVKFEIGCTLSPDVIDLVSLEIFSRATSAPISGSINLTPKSSVELKIRASTIEKSRLTNPSLLKSEGVTFGTFWLSSRSGTDEVSKMTETFPIRGILVEGKTFTLSEKQLVFQTAVGSDSDDEKATKAPTIQEKRVLIRNLSSSFPVRIQVNLEYPIEFTVNADTLIEIPSLDSESCVTIEAGGVADLALLLKQSSLFGESENFKLNFVDTGAVMPKIQTISIKFVDEQSIPKMVSSPVKEATFLFDSPVVTDPVDVSAAHNREKQEAPLNQSEGSDAKPVIELKGCKKSICSVTGEFQGLYVLELGQVDLSSTSLVKKLVLDLVSGNRTNYKVSTSNSFDMTFVTLSRIEGTLDQANSTSTVLLSFNLSNPGTWATYLILENTNNPLDTKYVRIMMEVVAKQNVKRVSLIETPSTVAKVAYNHGNRIFDVYTNPMNPQNLQLDVGLVSYGVVYSDRSFVIHNWESVAMDFTISTNLPKEDQSEVMFSISRTGAKLFDTIRIEAESQKQVYLQFIFEPTEGKTAEIKQFDIYVNCRLIKDYQKVISFRAECQQPKLLISESDFTFSTTLKSDNEIPKCKGDGEFTITNNSKEQLEYRIVCESIYFTLETTTHKNAMTSMTSHFLQFLTKATGLDPSLYKTEDCNLPFGSSIKSFILNKSDRIKIIPNMQTILRDKETLKKQKYILEHFVIYNKKKPQEKHRLNVKLNLGHLREFQVLFDNLVCIRLCDPICTTRKPMLSGSQHDCFPYSYIGKNNSSSGMENHFKTFIFCIDMSLMNSFFSEQKNKPYNIT